MRKYTLSCKSTGMDCDFEVRNASSMEELMEEMDVHARRVHGFSIKDLDDHALHQLASKVIVTGE